MCVSNRTWNLGWKGNRFCLKFWKHELGMQQESVYTCYEWILARVRPAVCVRWDFSTGSVSEQMALCNLVLQFVGTHFARLPYEEILWFPADLKWKFRQFLAWGFMHVNDRFAELRRKYYRDHVCCALLARQQQQPWEMCFSRTRKPQNFLCSQSCFYCSP